MRRMILVPFLVILAVLAIAGGVGYWIFDNYSYYRTDDAHLTGNIVSVNAPMVGTLTTLSVKLNDTVKAGDTLAMITPAPSTSGTGSAIPVTSPINGTIVQVSGVQSSNVTPGSPLVQVVDLGAVIVTAYVDESAIDNVSKGQSVDVHIDAYPGTNFTGHVEQIVAATAGQFALLPNQDPTSGNFTKVSQRIPVIITLDGNGGKTLAPGLSVSVTIHLH